MTTSYDNSKFNGFSMCVPNENTGNERVKRNEIQYN